MLQKTYKETYVKVILGVETGYNINLYTIRTANHLMFDNINVEDQVLFSGQFIPKRNSFTLFFIMKHTFRQCPECLIPLTSDLCFIKHDKEAQKLEGQWRVVHKLYRDENFKVWFEKGHFVFGAVATPKHWYYKLFRKLKDNDTVTIGGWRYRQRTSIKSIMLSPVYENITI